MIESKGGMRRGRGGGKVPMGWRALGASAWRGCRAVRKSPCHLPCDCARTNSVGDMVVRESMCDFRDLTVGFDVPLCVLGAARMCSHFGGPTARRCDLTATERSGEG